jgi:serine protease SohB
LDALIQYALFLAKTITWVIALLVVFGSIMAAAMRNRGDKKGQIVVEKINDQYDAYEELLSHVTLEKPELKKWLKSKKQQAKQQQKNDAPDRKRLFVVDFEGDTKASDVGALTECVNAILTIANAEQDEVLIKIDSPGGMVHTYGLAAAQLHRIKKKQIPLQVAVDKVAASGGYLMAVLADKIMASPFAIVGSIGVIAQLPNFNRLLKKHDIDVELHTAGKYKRTLTLFGENTEAGREKFREELHDVHVLFQDFVREHRPQVAEDALSTGEHWFGQRAIDKALVDELMTSDEYLLSRAATTDLYAVKYEMRPSLADKIGLQAQAIWQAVAARLASENVKSPLQL